MLSGADGSRNRGQTRVIGSHSRTGRRHRRTVVLQRQTECQPLDPTLQQASLPVWQLCFLASSLRLWARRALPMKM